MTPKNTLKQVAGSEGAQRASAAGQAGDRQCAAAGSMDVSQRDAASPAGRRQGMTGAPEKVDRRIIRTRRALMDAFERLLAAKPMGAITVSALAQEAGVDRKTFYQHFGTFDGLLDAIAQQYVDQVLADADAAMAKMNGLTLNEETNAFFASINHHVLRDVVLERRYFENLSTEKLLSHLQGPLTQGIMERSNITRDLTPLQVQTSVTFLLGGMLAVYRSWLLSEQNTPLEEIGALVNDLVQNGLRRP